MLGHPSDGERLEAYCPYVDRVRHISRNRRALRGGGDARQRLHDGRVREVCEGGGEWILVNHLQTFASFVLGCIEADFLNQIITRFAAFFEVYKIIIPLHLSNSIYF